MAQPICPDADDDLPPPAVEDPPGAMVWVIAGCTLVLVYVAALALLRPGA
jgi:hypothetical protein